jgi:membrane protein YqaA with SNARE-associated domain
LPDTDATPKRSFHPLLAIYKWVLHWAETPYAIPALVLLSFSESSFFPIPPDVLLVALCVGSPKRSLRFAAYCSVASVLGGLAGYAIGYGLWPVVGGALLTIPGFSPDKYVFVRGWYLEYNFWIVFAAAFTPIPYKVITIAGGVCRLPLLGFTVASIIGRSARFFLVAGLIWRFGPSVKKLIETHFNKATLLFTALLVGFFLLLGALGGDHGAPGGDRNLVNCLADGRVEVRAHAIEQLSGKTGDTMGFVADAPADQRAGAVQKWKEWLESRPKAPEESP